MSAAAGESARGVVGDAGAAAGLLEAAIAQSWLLAAFVRLASTGSLDGDTVRLDDADATAAAEVLAAAGLLVGSDDGFTLSPGLAAVRDDGTLDTRCQGIQSTQRQLATALGILDDTDTSGWAAHDDATLLAQGRASALGGTMLARWAVPSLEGLASRFEDGGWFLDVGVGVGELAAAFCDALPAARVVGIDVLPRALDLARATVESRGLSDRVELRRQPVQELDDVDRFDLAWLPAPFIPMDVFDAAVERVHRSLRVGGWLVIGAGRFAGDPLAAAVTRWQTVRAGGTPLPAADALGILEGAGFTDAQELSTLPGAPALYGARRP